MCVCSTASRLDFLNNVRGESNYCGQLKKNIETVNKNFAVNLLFIQNSSRVAGLPTREAGEKGKLLNVSFDKHFCVLAGMIDEQLLRHCWLASCSYIFV